MRGPEARCESPLELDGVDGEDSLRAGEARSLDGAGADPSDADDRHVVSRPHLGGVDGRPPPGRDAAPDEAGLVQRDVVEDLHAGRLIHDGVLGERAQAHHGVEILSPGMVPGGSVQLAARHERGAHVAQVRVAGGAGRALPAGGHESEDDVVTGGQPSHAGADLFDHAGTFMPTDHGQRAREVTGHRCSSEWHMPDAASLTSTSPSRGGSSSIGSTLQSLVPLPQYCRFGLHGVPLRRGVSCSP